MNRPWKGHLEPASIVAEIYSSEVVTKGSVAMADRLKNISKDPRRSTYRPSRGCSANQTDQLYDEVDRIPT